MRKLLVGTAAVALGLALAAPAQAEGVKLNVGGHMKGYVTWHDQDTDANEEERDLDILRETEVHFSGETTLDNGLTVGIHIEAEADGGTQGNSDSFDIDESYAYFSGAWGRVNFGDEDGAAYLLQVAAPSADSNHDGIRQYVQPTNYAGLLNDTTTLQANFIALRGGEGLDYDNDLTTNADKLTYLSPVFSGFQAGVSYTPDTIDLAPASNSLGGVNADDVNDVFGEAWEAGVRWEGMWEEIGIAFGAGYTDVSLENDNNTGEDDFTEWNVGLDLDWGPFGLGVVWTENNNGLDVNDENETWVVGLDYTTGPFKLGASYLNNDNDIDAAVGTGNGTVETDRYTGGVQYTYGPGMTFRGSISFVDHDVTGFADAEATSVLLGTQIDF